MNLVNYEFKARLRNEKRIRAALKKLRARFVGTDHQVDTYFRVPRRRGTFRSSSGSRMPTWWRNRTLTWSLLGSAELSDGRPSPPSPLPRGERGEKASTHALSPRGSGEGRPQFMPSPLAGAGREGL